MTEDNSNDPKAFLWAEVSPTVIEEVLQHIDENLYSHPLLSDETAEGRKNEFGFDSLPFPPAPSGFPEKIREIHNAQAPYYVVSGNLIAKIIKTAHNLVIKIFGRKQAYFNNLILDVLDNMASYWQEYHKIQTAQINTLAGQIGLQIEQLEAMRIEYQRLVDQLEQLVSNQDNHQE